MKILLLAGEESGVLYARALRERLAGHEVRGYGDYGFRTEDLAVMGLDAVLRRIFFLMRVKRTMMRAIDEWKPDVLCTIDYPGMNLRLAAYAKARGVRTVHVVCPQVWAWKAGRIPKIERSLDHLCCFLPFEPALFRPGFAEFVGHPLVAQIQPEPRMSSDGPLTLALLPGSRLSEVEKHLPVLLDTLKALEKTVRLPRVVIPAANARVRTAIERYVASSGLVSSAVSVQNGGARELLLRADCAVVASGTATLEAALACCPTVLVYKAAPLFAFVARRVIRGIRFIGLANIIWDKTLSARGTPPDAALAPMPELLQENLTVPRLMDALRPLLSDAAARKAARERLAGVRTMLASTGDAIGRIVSRICSQPPQVDSGARCSIK